jgi:hypothetical protein
MTDSFEQYRHELMRKLAYEYWERRGRPFGSSEVDWSAAEKAIDPYLLLRDRNSRLSRFVRNQMRVRLAPQNRNAPRLPNIKN